MVVNEINSLFILLVYELNTIPQYYLYNTKTIDNLIRLDKLFLMCE